MSDTVDIASTANVLYLCRLCGTESTSQDELIHIFDTNGVALNIKSKIENCLSLYVSETDHLPKVVCAECVDNLEKFNEFKIKSNKTAFNLTDLLRKQMLVDDNEEQIDGYQVTESDVLKINDFIEASNTNPSFLVPMPPLQLSKVDNSSIKTKNALLKYNICKAALYSAHPKTTENSKTKNKSNNKKVKAKSDTKKSKSKPIPEPVPTEYKCALCPKVSDSKSKMQRHVKYHVETLVSYDCTLCGITLKSKQSMTTHMKIHNKQFNYICNYCGKGFVLKTGFEIHIRTTHTKDYPFQCPKCDKKFPSKGILKTHDQTAHNDVRNFICGVCNKSFKVKSYLQSHERVHLPKESRIKYKCHLCEATFIDSHCYKSHILGHTGELKFECTLCKNKYKDSKGLKIHLLTHTGEKDHVCDVCGKAFALNSNLRAHRRIHTGERPYKCNACQKTFTQRSALNRHKKSCSKE